MRGLYFAGLWPAMGYRRPEACLTIFLLAPPLPLGEGAGGRGCGATDKRSPNSIHDLLLVAYHANM
jgi:hypothetical protein